MYKQIEFHIKGSSALLLHNGAMANPLNPLVIQLKTYTSKRKKTESDYEKMSELEWKGSLYVDNNRVVIPGEVLEAVVVNGAKKKRAGTQAKIAIFVEQSFPLIYDGPQNIEKLWQDERFRFVAGVVVSRSRIMRTRPIFKQWELKFVVTYNDEIINANELVDWVVTAGQQVGLCDWRPKFGRFEVLSHKEL